MKPLEEGRRRKSDKFTELQETALFSFSGTRTVGELMQIAAEASVSKHTWKVIKDVGARHAVFSSLASRAVGSQMQHLFRGPQESAER